MRHPDTGVPLRAVKSFLSRIPDVFTGEDLVGWLRKTYDIDTADEAIHLGMRLSKNLIANFGCIFLKRYSETRFPGGTLNVRDPRLY